MGNKQILSFIFCPECKKKTKQAMDSVHIERLETNRHSMSAIHIESYCYNCRNKLDTFIEGNIKQNKKC